MEELEQLLAEAETENKRLQEENDVLRNKTGKLAKENHQLKVELVGVIGSDDSRVVSVAGSPESAVLATPLPQEQTPPVTKPTSSHPHASHRSSANSSMKWLQMLITLR